MAGKPSSNPLPRDLSTSPPCSSAKQAPSSEAEVPVTQGSGMLTQSKPLGTAGNASAEPEQSIDPQPLLVLNGYGHSGVDMETGEAFQPQSLVIGGTYTVQTINGMEELVLVQPTNEDEMLEYVVEQPSDGDETFEYVVEQTSDGDETLDAEDTVEQYLVDMPHPTDGISVEPKILLEYAPDEVSAAPATCDEETEQSERQQTIMKPRAGQVSTEANDQSMPKEHSSSDKDNVSATCKSSATGYKLLKYQCDVCYHIYSSSTHLRTHYRIHTGEKPYCCEVCKQTFAQKINLDEHMMDHTGHRPFGCADCSKRFKRKAYLLSHMMTNHTNANSATDRTCDKCGRVLRSKYHLLVHQRSHKVVPPKRYECPDCLRVFRRKDHWLVHNTIHSGVRPYSCEQCGKRFRTYWLHKRHVQRHTTLQCPLCGMTFTMRGSYKSHMKQHRAKLGNSLAVKSEPSDTLHSTKPHKPLGSSSSHLQPHDRGHAGEKPFCCMVCNKQFSVHHSLKEHMMDHTGHRPFACEVCPKRFKRNAHLLKHIRSHNTAHRTCDECGKVLASTVQLAVHQRNNCNDSPKLYECPECPRVIRKKDNFLIHLRVHTGEKPYTCKQCGKCFRTHMQHKIHVQRHVTLHCPLCGMTFLMRRQYRSHMKQHKKKQRKKGNAPHRKTIGPKSGHCWANVGPAGPALGQRCADATLLSGALRDLFCCAICETALSTKPELQRHMQMEHSGEENKVGTCYVFKASPCVDVKPEVSPVHTATASEKSEVSPVETSSANEQSEDSAIETCSTATEMSENSTFEIRSVSKKLKIPSKSVKSKNKVSQYHCMECSQVFDNRDDIQLHMEQHVMN